MCTNMITKELPLIDQFQQYVPHNLKVFTNLYKDAIGTIIDHRIKDLVTEPAKLDDIRTRVANILDLLDPKRITEHKELKAFVASKDLQYRFENILLFSSEYYEKRKIVNQCIDDEKIELPQLSDLISKEFNYFRVTTTQRLPGTYPDFVNIKLYNNGQASFLRVREFFKYNYFQQEYLGKTFQDKYHEIKKHKHCDNQDLELFVRIPLRSQDELHNKTMFVINHIRNNPRKMK